MSTLLDSITDAARAGKVTKKDILAAFERGASKRAGSQTQSLTIGEILYYIGGAIIFIGIAVLVFQNWETLPDFAKILVTFGSGIAAYFMGLAFGRDKKLEKLSNAFFFLSAILMPLGLFIVFDLQGYDMTAGVNSVIAGALLAMYLASFALLKKDVFLLFSIIFGTWFYFAVINYVVTDFLFIEEWRFAAYQVLVAGASYLLLGYGFAKSARPEFSGFLYGFGNLGFLSAALSLGGWSPEQSIFWELLFPALVFGGMFLSVHLKAKSFLIFGSMFLMMYILKITGEYFTEGLGWPLSLVIAGFALIGVGYYSFYLNRKFVSRS